VQKNCDFSNLPRFKITPGRLNIYYSVLQGCKNIYNRRAEISRARFFHFLCFYA
jgi:hypothetical protein